MYRVAVAHEDRVAPRLDNITLIVSDREAAIRFYAQTLMTREISHICKGDDG